MSFSQAQTFSMPLDGAQNDRLKQALGGLSAQQLQWVSGYAAGLAATNNALAPATEPGGETLTVLYGSQTGNGERIARRLQDRAREQGYSTRLVSLADYKASALKRETLVSFVVSTHGEGDPPDDAELFREFLLSKQAPKLDGLRYTVLALGDSSYINFCQTGREFDARLAELGAKRIVPTIECDIDYEASAAEWSEALLERVRELAGEPAELPRLRAVQTELGPRYDKQNPFAAEVLVNQKITAGASTKDVRHIELSLEGSGIAYEPGDALAIVATNPPRLVEQIIEVLDLDGEAVVQFDDAELPLHIALSNKLEITTINLGFLRSWAEHANDAAAQQGIEALFEPGNKEALRQFVDTHQVIDVVRRYPASIDAQSLVNALRRLGARSYSIASSANANPDEVHLTVAAVRYQAHGSEHWGAASTYLADRLDLGDTLDVYVETNSRFRLPKDDTTDIIMVGPGTGVAPFRAFVEERAERGASGDNWLFFGDRSFSNDFLYQLEWQRHLKQGNLARLDVAFSRDQAEKVYVQDRIRENGAEVHRWLQRGAHLYVCGDAKHMAGDVERALVDVIATHAGIDRDKAHVHLKELRRSGRYQRDVY